MPANIAFSFHLAKPDLQPPCRWTSGIPEPWNPAFRYLRHLPSADLFPCQPEQFLRRESRFALTNLPWQRHTDFHPARPIDICRRRLRAPRSWDNGSVPPVTPSHESGSNGRAALRIAGVFFYLLLILIYVYLPLFLPRFFLDSLFVA